MLIDKFVEKTFGNKTIKILELGSGDQADALKVTDKMNGEYIAVDKLDCDNPTNNITFIKNDYSDIANIDKLINKKNFDLIFSNYSICFNTKERILEFLPYYFNKIAAGGYFYLSDFCTDEEIVKRRTNLDSQWFFDLISANFKTFEASRSEVFEKEHNHNHRIFELVAVK